MNIFKKIFRMFSTKENLAARDARDAKKLADRERFLSGIRSFNQSVWDRKEEVVKRRNTCVHKGAWCSEYDSARCGSCDVYQKKEE